MGEEKRLLKGDEDPNGMLQLGIDYVKVHEKLAELRQFTKNFVFDALDKSGIKYDRD